ncbi:hypothetical protein RhiirA5_494633 [Rhizophagus irregularis]|uniref:Uncharacterized protein n=1 Tax=Rhizophagus irregularis TaxID=588596 RepID=A0A2N0Q8E7_9GLOM|nr:hypothetical protein RhiirA5_494633 [Rhizophagus irregularis]
MNPQKSKLHKDEDQSVNVDYGKDDITKKEEDYQITICQDGKFVATVTRIFAHVISDIIW